MYLRFSLIVGFMLAGASAFGSSFYIGGGVGVSSVNDQVETGSGTLFVPNMFPTSLSLDGSQVDSSETLGTVFVGWEANDWIALELGYSDHGEFTQPQSIAFFSTTQISFPFPSGTALVQALPSPVPSISPSLGVEEWSLTTKFSKTLFSEFSAIWSLAVTQTEFDVEGQLGFNRIVSTNPLEFMPVILPYDGIGGELGYIYGFGFAWDFNERLSADIGYRKHDTQVVEAESVTLRFILNL